MSGPSCRILGQVWLEKIEMLWNFPVLDHARRLEAQTGKKTAVNKTKQSSVEAVWDFRHSRTQRRFYPEVCRAASVGAAPARPLIYNHKSWNKWYRLGCLLVGDNAGLNMPFLSPKRVVDSIRDIKFDRGWRDDLYRSLGKCINTVGWI